MPKNLPIEGGRPIGAPANWDVEKHGPCGTLNVLIQPPSAETNHLPRLTSAYRLTPAEHQAMADGVLFLSIVAQQHPVISMWVQDSKGTPIGDGILVGDADTIAHAAADGSDDTRLLEIGFAAMMAELDLQAEQRSNQPEIGEADPIGQTWMKGTFALKDALAVALEAIGTDLAAQRTARPPDEVVEIPIMTLEALGAQAQAEQAIDGIQRLRDAGFEVTETEDTVRVSGSLEDLARFNCPKCPKCGNTGTRFDTDQPCDCGAYSWSSKGDDA